MNAEFGHLAVILAFMVAIVQMAVPLTGALKGWQNWMAVAVPAALLQAALIALSFASLTWAFVTSDFSVALVANNSHSAKPMIYKISGTWGNHEGSLLLWVLILTLFGAAVALWGRALPGRLKALVLSVQASIAVAFLAFLLFTSNPFERLAVPPLDGNDLNPLLQDPGLAFHPPFLYLGYVGLSMAFSFAIAALIDGRVDPAWARWVRPWTLAAWLFLTIGIGIGSWWAYYELGWGGWWFWDPVENASFMPWLFATALLHSAIVVEKRNTLKSWTILLAILAFSFSLIGTFIVRSGVITSVHAFANDPTRGMFILLILAVFIGGALTLYAFRANALRSDSVFSLVSRESALVMNNLLLVVAALVVFVGTVWPLVAEMATGRKLSVGPPFFNLSFTPFMVALAMMLPLGAILPWKRARPGRAMRPLWGPLALSVALGALVWSLQTGGRMLGPVGAVLATWVLLGALADLGQRARVGKAGAGEVLRRLGSLPRADWGKAVAHGGMGVMIFAISAITAWQQEDIRVVQPGERFAFAGYELTLERVERVEGPNYSSDMAFIALDRDGRRIATLTPEKRFYPVQRFPTTEAGIDLGVTRDVYVVIGEQQPDGGWVVRSFVKPFANWLWAAVAFMALGGVLSLTDRRYRLGAAVRPAARAVPAE
ncbi:heme lyase CcmF/NrfE family subunit [Rhodobacteraceae bacterium 2CG4]|uniref:Heme lyase CcmF/NrfE family subunit n=1 Tax=Halovulum marinum TaxID=2662447 RepID=A0A6L5Z0I5_9RHOB|nr:heme lyase CcmF/NrfE family subunit [Halovulum marinum]MSU90008.1 heme lyase CcmF/NrfE family subunit [Halovulum marinum]